MYKDRKNIIYDRVSAIFYSSRKQIIVRFNIIR